MAKKTSSNDKMIGVIGDISSALENMGFSKGEIAQAVSTILPTATFSEGLRQCLKYLGSKPGSNPPAQPAKQKTQPAPVQKPAQPAKQKTQSVPPPRAEPARESPTQPQQPKNLDKTESIVQSIKDLLTTEFLKTHPSHKDTDKPTGKAEPEDKDKAAKAKKPNAKDKDVNPKKPNDKDKAAKEKNHRETDAARRERVFQEEREQLIFEGRHGSDAGNRGGALSRIGKTLLHNYQDEGRYNNELQDKDASKFHKGARGLLKLASGGNSSTMRAFDYLTSKKKDKLQEFDEKHALELTRNETSKAIDTSKDESAESLSGSKPAELLEKIINKLNEIKQVLTGMKPKGVPGLKSEKRKLLPAPEGRKLLPAPKPESKKFRPATAETAIKLSRYRPARPMLDINKQAKGVFPKPAKPKIGKLLSSGLPKFTSPQKSVPGVKGLPSMKPDIVSLPSTPGISNTVGGSSVHIPRGALGGSAQAGRATLPMLGVIAAAGAGAVAGTAINKAYGKEIGGGVESVFGEAGKDKTEKADKFAKQTAADLKKKADMGKAMSPAQITFMKDNGIDVSGITPAGSELVANTEKARMNANAIAPHLDRELEAQGVTKTPKQKAMVLGQISHETGGFSKMREGDYSAKRVWDLRGKELEKRGVSRADVFAAEKAGGSAAMDEYMMADKYRGKDSKLGNTEPGDATKYKGRGAIQLTGKANYQKASKDLGIDLVNKPELAEDPEIAAKITAWKLKTSPVAMRGIQEGDIDRLSQGINGGKYKKSHGRAERISKTLQAEQQLSTLKKGASQVSANEIEAKTLEIAKASTQPIVIQAGNQATPQQTVASNAGANKGVAPMIARNTDSSISAITRAQMGYGLA